MKNISLKCEVARARTRARRTEAVRPQMWMDLLISKWLLFSCGPLDKLQQPELFQPE